ncbi:DUF2628 domain-containing protein [Roseomonas sp. SSH11]|uniref:DUF2628 domain-containing protein n=1 Tax=Pararoseomonas baculiformis TaxID=2820812 RepID=A0ABS4AC85_9PROT|nr:DUF2628 domain-containing protein [Pararoseomonas baculiformis]MBP0444614.1 DUF2628 domain-containing protein [Pararoseomonas baculiformis]
MRIFTVHARTGEKPRTRLVPEAFSFWAFLFGPFWLLWRGLWLALLGYGVLAVAIAFLPDPWEGWAGLALHLLLGFHAYDLERWTLRRRGYAEHGVVAAPDEDMAVFRLVRARPELARGVMA